MGDSYAGFGQALQMMGMQRASKAILPAIFLVGKERVPHPIIFTTGMVLTPLV
jgi:hypothetical protein